MIECCRACSTLDSSSFDFQTVGLKWAVGNRERKCRSQARDSQRRKAHLGKRRIERAKQDKKVVAQLLGQFRRAQHGL